MDPNLANILNHATTPITNEQLAAYLAGTLSDAERHKVEESFANQGFEEESLEGLEHINPATLSAHRAMIENNLMDTLQLQTKRAKKPLKMQPLILILITSGFLLIILLAYFFIHWMMNNG